MITFSNVHLAYPYDDFEVFKGVTFNLVDGVNTVLCDTQSGKTSLCKLLCKQIKPTYGEILVDGTSLASITNAHLGILYLPQKPDFFDRRSVLYNIEYPLRVRKASKALRKSKVDEVASQLGIDSLLQVKVNKLNAAEKRLVALARGLTVPRKVVLFDDFFDGASDDDRLNVQTVLAVFPDAMRVVISSDPDVAIGNTVVLDGGVTVYQGDNDYAKQTVNSLSWLHGNLRS